MAAGVKAEEQVKAWEEVAPARNADIKNSTKEEFRVLNAGVRNATNN
ncbi:MAG: hypothetical protein Q7J68_03485 [Thermoplasmata archaeon]|nr:hypothetical protein [Thermoplasmata archaeon]